MILLTSKTFKSRRVPTPGTLPYLLLLLVLFGCGFAALRYPLRYPLPARHHRFPAITRCRMRYIAHPSGKARRQKPDRLPSRGVESRKR